MVQARVESDIYFLDIVPDFCRDQYSTVVHSSAECNGHAAI